MTTYTFRVVVERDEDAWHAYAPELEDKGAATWGATREEALSNLHEVLQLVVADMVATDDPLPKGIATSPEALVSVTV